MQYLSRHTHAPMPHQTWRAFPPEAIVKVWNAYGDSRTGPAGKMWWGYERECGRVGEGVITRARRLDKPKGYTQ